MIIPRALTSERDSCSGTTEPLWSITIPSILQLRPTAISFAYHTVQKKLDNGQEVGYHFKKSSVVFQASDTKGGGVYDEKPSSMVFKDTGLWPA